MRLGGPERRMGARTERQEEICSTEYLRAASREPRNSLYILKWRPSFSGRDAHGRDEPETSACDRGRRLHRTSSREVTEEQRILGPRRRRPETCVRAEPSRRIRTCGLERTRQLPSCG